MTGKTGGSMHCKVGPQSAIEVDIFGAKDFFVLNAVIPEPAQAYCVICSVELLRVVRRSCRIDDWQLNAE